MQMEEGGLLTKRGRKLCIYMKWRPNRYPIGSKCLN